MEKLMFKKLIVLNNEDKVGKEIEFEAGLNIILGRNKTGKSSLIKSLFHTMGCKVSFESSWKKFISTYLLIFSYNNKNYLLKRKAQQEIYSLYEMDESNLVPIKAIYKDVGFESHTESLMGLFDINIKLMTRNNVEKTITPPLLFSFNYIEQDNGWGTTLGNNFAKVNYFKNWNNFIIKYFVGYQNNQYFTLKNLESNLKTQQNESKNEIDSVNNFISKIFSEFEKQDLEVNNNVNQNNDLQNLTLLEKEQIKLKNEINLLSNQLYEINLNIKLVNSTIEELKEDHKFSQKQPVEINCPTCGTVHKNTFDHKLFLIEDIQSGNELLHLYRVEKKAIDDSLTNMNKSLKEVVRNYNKSYLAARNKEENASIINTIKAEGRKELININQKELNNMEREFEKISNQITMLKIEQDSILSRKRSAQIRESISEIFQSLLLELNVINSNYKFTNFKVSLSEFSGSELPRAVLAYYVSLYLYNLERKDFPFKFIVIDTPNQQGQDSSNLDLIHKVLESLLNKRGQAIIGTEREIGFEDQANLIPLSTVNGSLNSRDFENNTSLIECTENIYIY